MSISISTSEYKTTKTAEIDGVEFKVRPMSSAEALAFTQIGEDLKELTAENKNMEAIEKVNQLGNLFFGLFEPEAKARKILEPLSYDAWFEIYGKIMNEDEKGDK